MSAVGIGESLILAGIVCGVIIIAVVLRRRVWKRHLPGLPDRFDTLALRAGGKVVAERLIAGELRKGANNRFEAIERAIERLDRDRRTWR